MRKILIFTALGLVAALPAVASQAPSPAPSRQVTVAVVRDGPTPARDMVALVERELKELLPGVEVRFLASPDFGAGWQADRAESALQAALTDPEVDLVLADGAMITARASAGELPKPVVSAYLQRADLFGLYDAEHDRSSKENLAWLLISGRDESDFEAFRGLVPFETAALLLPRAYLDSGEPMASALVWLVVMATTVAISNSAAPLRKVWWGPAPGTVGLATAGGVGLLPSAPAPGPRIFRRAAP